MISLDSLVDYPKLSLSRGLAPCKNRPHSSVQYELSLVLHTGWALAKRKYGVLLLPLSLGQPTLLGLHRQENKIYLLSQLLQYVVCQVQGHLQEPLPTWKNLMMGFLEFVGITLCECLVYYSV